MIYRIIVILVSALVVSTAHGQNSSIYDYMNSESFSRFCQDSVYSQSSSGVPSAYLIARPNFSWNNLELFSSIRDFSQRNYRIEKTSLVAPYTSKVIYRVQDKVYDIELTDDRLWVLLENRVDVISLDGHLLNSIELPSSSYDHKYDRAFDMVSMGGYIIVANGLRGLAYIDQETEYLQFERDLGLSQPNGHKSLAVSITKSANQLYVAVSGLTVSSNSDKAFNGIIRTSLEKNSAVENFSISRRSSGVISIITKMGVVDQTLILNNWGSIQSVELGRLRPSKEFNIGWTPTLFEESGLSYHGEALGEFLVHKGEFLSCAKISQVKTTKRTAKKAGRLRLSGF